MTFSEQINRIQGLLNKGSFPNEASISQGIILPLLQEIGWNIHDPARQFNFNEDFYLHIDVYKISLIFS